MINWYQHEKPINYSEIIGKANEKNRITEVQIDRRRLHQLIEDLMTIGKITKDHHEHIRSIYVVLLWAIQLHTPIEIRLKYLPKAVSTIIDRLEQRKLIERKKGISDIKNLCFFYTKIRPTDLFNSRFGLKHKAMSFSLLENARVLIKKDDNGVKTRENLSSETTDGAIIMHHNQFIIRHRVQCTLSQNENYKKKDYLWGKWGVVDLNPQIQRIFSDEIKKGGRLYAQSLISFQSLKKTTRRTITIDGTDTVEIDYSRLHPSILYNLKELPAPQDSYGVFQTEDKDLINACKKAFSAMLNSKNKDEAIKSISYEFYCKEPKIGAAIEELTGERKQTAINQLVQKIESFHKPIDDYFYKECWSWLHFKDSSLMLLVLKMLDDQMIPALPIHDSVIVPVNYQGATQEIMHRAYERAFHYPIKITSTAT